MDKPVPLKSFMNPDTSAMLLEAYLVHQDKTVDVVLRNGTLIRRYISGFIKGSELAEDPFVMKWHMVKLRDSNTLGWDCSGSSVGEIIAHSEIQEITFLESGCCLTFS